MTITDLTKSALNTMNSGYYFNSKNEKIELSKRTDNVMVFPRQILNLMKPDLYLKKTLKNIRVLESDTYECAKKYSENGNTPVVLNFANAFTPGGGFLYGATAQEEVLCRRSTLFLSINSNKAQELMYKKNQKSKKDLGTILLSPKVQVFKDMDYNFLDRPYTVSVITAAAVNLSCLNNSTIKAMDITGIMKRKIRNILSLADCCGFKNVVLGAWGCGAFGHDPINTALCFRDILIDEGYIKCFDNVDFAIIGNDNLCAFKNVFK